MVVASPSVAQQSNNLPYLGQSQSEQASRLPIADTSSTSSSSLKLPELANWPGKPRKRSSTSSVMSATSLSSSTFSPFLTMHPMLGHLPAKSKQTVMYIMMMSQAPMSMAVPTVNSMSSSKSLAARKFSECIGMKQPTPNPMEENWAARIAADGSTELVPKRIKIFEGGFKSNEDYTYVRGRGRGKYVCEECGIRCKKPSMLKKHIRTHTDLRPYSCRHCAFAFKTKGNLTKHMKSKAHHKKCVELGIIPVPTTIDDSQIDSDALAKQEQYELLNGGASGGLNQFADDDEDCDEDYDEEEFEDEDEEDDEGVPIPLIEQQRLTYIVPGQFDDAEQQEEANNVRKLSTASNNPHKSSIVDGPSTFSATSPRPKLSITSSSSPSSSMLSLSNTASSTLPLSITDIRAGTTTAEQELQNDKCRKMSSSTAALLSAAVSNKMAISSNSLQSSTTNKADMMFVGSIATSNQHQQQPSQTCAQSYHHFSGQASAIGMTESNKGQHQQHHQRHASQHRLSSTNRSASPHPNSIVTKEHEAEAARSLLILSGAASELGAATNSTAANSSATSLVTRKSSDGGHRHSSSDATTVENALLQSMYRSQILAKKASTGLAVDFHQLSSALPPPGAINQSSSTIEREEVSLPKPDRILYEHAADHVLLASQNQPPLPPAAVLNMYPNGTELHRLPTAESIEMMRRTSSTANLFLQQSQHHHQQKVVDRRTSQPTSVIISRSSPIEIIESVPPEEERRRKRSRHERSISESSNHSASSAHQHLRPSAQSHLLDQGRPLSVSPKNSNHLLSVSSLITHPMATFVNTSAATTMASVFSDPAYLLQQQLALGVRNPRAALIAEEIKRGAMVANANAEQQAMMTASGSMHRIPMSNSHSPPLPYGSASRDIRQPSVSETLSAIESANMLQQKLVHQFYENIAKQQQQQLSPSQFKYHANLVEQQRAALLTEAQKVSHHHLGVGLSSPLAIATANGSLKAAAAQSMSNMSYLVPTTNTTSSSSAPAPMDPKKVAFMHQALSSAGERNISPHQMSAPSVARHFAPSSFSTSSSNVPLPPPPSSPLPAPVTFDPSTRSKSQSAGESELPMDLSKNASFSSVTTVVEPASVVPLDSPPLRITPTQASSLSPTPITHLAQLEAHSPIHSPNHLATQFAVLSPNRPRFRPLIEEKHLTEQLVRAFSPYAEVHPMTFKSNGREVYKNVRSEEFAHLAPGVHTPHRLPQNMLMLGARSNSSANSTTTMPVTSTAGGQSNSPTLIRALPGGRSAALSNAYTTAEGKSVCSICMKQFSKPSQLRLHINIHFFERPFRCDSCAVSFRTKGHLQKHSRSVSHLNKLNMNNTFGRPSTDNPRPFKCSDCKIAFRIHGHLAKHLRSKMHIMKLECLGKLPFGMYAEMERSHINLTPIDTTDCEKALESLRLLAQKLYDPRQMCWKVTEPSGADGMDDVIEEDIDGDELLDGEDEDGYEDDVDMADGQLIISDDSLSATSKDSQRGGQEWPPVAEPISSTRPLQPVLCSNVQQQQTLLPPSPPSVTITTLPPSISPPAPSSGAIASTRSNTCPLCLRTFKSPKSLQVHLHSDEHPEVSNETVSA